MKKAIDTLTNKQKKIVLDCLYAAADGPFFPNWEFNTLIGANRDALRATAARVKENATSGDDSWIITNSLNNLLGYPHDEFGRWHNHFDFSIQDMQKILNKLLLNK